MSKRKPTCDWCKKAARYEHPHVMGEPERACADHHQGCTRCRPLGGDKYWDKPRQEQLPAYPLSCRCGRRLPCRHC